MSSHYSEEQKQQIIKEVLDLEDKIRVSTDSMKEKLRFYRESTIKRGSSFCSLKATTDWLEVQLRFLRNSIELMTINVEPLTEGKIS